MYGQVIVHGRLEPASKAEEVTFRPSRTWQLVERRAAVIRLLEKARHQQWVRVESVKASHRSTLLKDNPTSG